MMIGIGLLALYDNYGTGGAKNKHSCFNGFAIEYHRDSVYVPIEISQEY